MSEWIETKDKLPPMEHWVLGYDRSEVIFVMLDTCPWPNSLYWVCFSRTGITSRDMNDITHWMPLPEEPK